MNIFDYFKQKAKVLPSGNSDELQTDFYNLFISDEKEFKNLLHEENIDYNIIDIMKWAGTYTKKGRKK